MLRSTMSSRSLTLKSLRGLMPVKTSVSRNLLAASASAAACRAFFCSDSARSCAGVEIQFQADSEAEYQHRDGGDESGAPRLEAFQCARRQFGGFARSFFLRAPFAPFRQLAQTLGQ